MSSVLPFVNRLLKPGLDIDPAQTIGNEDDFCSSPLAWPRGQLQWRMQQVLDAVDNDRPCAAFAVQHAFYA
jgi:hypothetical protein